MRPFSITTDRGRREWAAVIKAMEGALVLYRHSLGTLARLWRYLHDRTGGSICGLSDLIRESAIEAVLSGQETITRGLMDTIEISEYAQTYYHRNRRTAHARR
ncbi:hypothetical protein GCM10010174_66540 [Kutzneria viridogrisea]|uniref:Uncharacterized protein n=1 Tax=Kutzneria viridogrisea TaxID=47990 RepID=A0ABR6B9Z2_9PSEU|nr:hypothetical protein [Kutzneria viridogrisea]